MVDSRESPNSLYDEGIATMEGGGSYNQTDAEGFLRIQGLPSTRPGPRDATDILARVIHWRQSARQVMAQASSLSPRPAPSLRPSVQ